MVVSGWQLTADVRTAPRPALHVAALVLHAQQGDDFFGDTSEARVIAAVRAAGIAADLVHVYYPRGDDSGCTELEAALLRWITEHHVDVVVVGQVWRESLLAGLHGAGCLVVGTDPNGQWQSNRPDLLLAHFPRHRSPLVQLLLALREGCDLADLTNVAVADGDRYAAARVAPAPDPDETELAQPFAACADAVVFGQPRNRDGTVPLRRKTLDTNVGCPFADDAARNPAFAEVDLSAPNLAHKGCAFCPMGGDYRALPVAQTVAAHVAQLRYWQDHLAEPLDEAVLRDQSALRYLPQLVQACKAAGLRPLGLLVPGRGDAILRYGPQLRQAAEACADSGWWFTIHLVGFESFSQPQLDLYNKGVTVAQYTEALQQMRALHREFPQAFRLYAHGASSFILFNPWTTLDDLDATARFCADNAVGELAHGLTLSRLRLYPNLPLYWKARADGLLVNDAPAADRGAAFAGYSAEANWRYLHPAVAAVETVQRALADRIAPSEGVGLLHAVVRWARTRFGPDAPAWSDGEQRALLDQWDALQALWRPGSAPVGRTELRRARTVVAGRTCNNHCRTCTADHAEYEDRPDHLQPLVLGAAQTGQLVFAGREPTLLPQFLGHVRRAAKAGASRIEAISNARALSTAGAGQRLRAAGLTDLGVKRHRVADRDEDEITRSPGSGVQNREAMMQLRAAGVPWTLHWIVVREGLAELDELPAWARAHGARAIAVRVLAGEIEVGNLPGWLRALQTLRAASEQVGLQVEIAGP